MSDTTTYAQEIVQDLMTIIRRTKKEETQAVCECILECYRDQHTIICAGAGRSKLMIRAFSMRMMHMGMASYVAGETSTPAIREHDVLVIGSGSGETGGLKGMAKKAKDQGASIIVITRNQTSTLASMADHVLYIPIEYGKSGLQPGGSTFEQGMLLMMDALFKELMDKGNFLEDGQSYDEFISIRHANLE